MASIARYTAQRLAGRAGDATVNAAGNWWSGRGSGLTLSTAARGWWDRGMSLLGGKYSRSWAIGVDGFTTRGYDDGMSGLLGLLSQNELVYACLRERMKVLIAPSFVVERRAGDGNYAIETDHPLTALFRRPQQNLDTASLWRCFEASYSCTGRVYLEPIYASRPKLLIGLNPLNPAYMNEVIENGKLVRYEWSPGTTETVDFGPDELIVRRAVDWADVPPLIAALGSVEADRASTEFIRGFFANGGVPSGIVKVRGSWSQALTDAFRQTWMERFGPGGMAQGGPAIFDENIESYTRLGVSLNELDNEQLRTFLESRICMCFGIPPLIIYSYAGLLRSTYSNLEEAWASFWDATALPLLSEWASWIDWSLLTQYEDPREVLLGNVRTRFDVSGIGPFQEDVDAKIAMMKEAYSAGAVTINEYRLIMGLKERLDGDVYRAPTSTVEDPALPALLRTLSEGTQRKALPALGRSTKAAAEPPVRLTRDVGVYLRDQYARARRLWIAGNADGANAVIAAIGEQLDDGIALFGMLAPAERKAYAASFKEAAARIDWDVVIDSGDVTAAVDELARRCVGIADITKQQIADLIVQGTQQQLTDAAIGDALADLGIARAKERAPLIVTTELANASVTAAKTAYQASGVVAELEWITAGSDVCDECTSRDGKRFALDMAPELPAHPRCRCDYAPIVSERLELAPAMAGSEVAV